MLKLLKISVLNQTLTNYYLVESIVKKVTKDKKRQSYLRIWKEGEYDNNNAKFFKNNPIHLDESIETWKNRVFGKKKFGLFLNYANSHSDELSQLLISHIQPFIKATGLPLGGISTTIILGDYGWTPLGIHRDNSGEYIIHYHLGPGSKDIYIWEKEKSDLHGFKRNVKPENTKEFMSDYSYKCSFSSGDIFSMTGKKVHIGNSQEFSISLVIEFNSLTQKELLEKMWIKLGDELFDKNFNGDKAKILPAYNKENHINYINYLTKGVKHYNVDVNQSVKKALEDVFLGHRYKLFSNAGFSLPPYVNEKKVKEMFKKTNLSLSFQLIEPYKILFYLSGKYLYLFIRGEKIRIRNYPKLPLLIDRINEGEELKISEIKNEFLSDWENSAIFKFVYNIYKLKGIQIQF